ncbi:MAG: hypothetical protein EOR46_27430, partial [Mesorhizobium sp.]
GQRPPLACRPSPPRGGRSDVTLAFANLQRRRSDRGAETANLPPCGEMAGRPEGGGTERNAYSLAALGSGQCISALPPPSNPPIVPPCPFASFPKR